MIVCLVLEIILPAAATVSQLASLILLRAHDRTTTLSLSSLELIIPYPNYKHLLATQKLVCQPQTALTVIEIVNTSKTTHQGLMKALP